MAAVAGVAVDRAALEAACAALRRRRSTRCRRCTRRSSATASRSTSTRAPASSSSARRAAFAIHSIGVVDGDGDLWTIDVACSKGTYIRTLGEDIGAALGCGAHLAALRRIGSGALDIAAAAAFAELDDLDESARDACLLPPDALVAALPRVVLSSDDAGRFLAGVRRRLPLADADAVRVYGPETGAFLGTGHVTAGELIATRLLSPAEVGDLVAAQRRPLPVSESLPA